MNQATNHLEPVRASRLPARVQIALGITVFGLLLLVMAFGSGVFQGRSGSSGQGAGNLRFDELPPDARLESALDRGDWVQAEAALHEMLEADQFDARAMFYLGYSIHQQGRLDEARQWYEKSTDFHRYKLVALYNLSCISALQGNNEQCLDELTRVIDGGFVSRRGIENDRDFRDLRDDPRFMELVKREQAARDRKGGSLGRRR